MKHHLATVLSGIAAVGFFALSWTWAQGVVIAIGAICAALIAIVSAVRLISGLAPVRWVWRALVAEPASHRLRAEVREAIEEWWSAPDGPGSRLRNLEDGAEEA